jgi:hypothetical protein
MNTKRLINLLGAGILVLLTACQAAGQPLSAAMVNEADTADGLTLSTGAADAAPLWAFCSADQENTHIRTFNCRAPVSQALAVGHLFLLADAALWNAGGADLEWELAIDDYLVDLESFGTFDSVTPAMPASPSPVREVFMTMTDWNLVMTNLNPGKHTLFFRAKNGAGYYSEWLVYLNIEGENETDISSIPFQPKS